MNARNPKILRVTKAQARNVSRTGGMLCRQLVLFHKGARILPCASRKIPVHQSLSSCWQRDETREQFNSDSYMPCVLLLQSMNRKLLINPNKSYRANKSVTQISIKIIWTFPSAHYDCSLANWHNLTKRLQTKLVGTAISGSKKWAWKIHYHVVRLRLTLQPRWQSDMVWCYIYFGLKINECIIKKLEFTTPVMC